MYERFAAPKELHWVEAADHFFAGALDEFEKADSGICGEWTRSLDQTPRVHSRLNCVLS